MGARALLALAILLGVGLALGGSPGSTRSQQVVRLGTWNLYNLFDDQDDPNADEVRTPQQVEAKLNQLAAVLRTLDADVIGVQEVEKQALLERLGRLAGYPQAILVEGNDQMRGIDVGLLSRLPVRAHTSHKDMVLPDVAGATPPIRFSRDCLEVELGGPIPLTVMVNHFKSKHSGGRTADAKRRAQAEGVAQLVKAFEAAHPVGNLAVVGDLNDDPNSWALEPLAALDLRDPFGSLDLPTRYTSTHRGQPIIIDHIRLTPALYAHCVKGSARVHRSPEIEHSSDHYPLTVDLRP